MWLPEPGLKRINFIKRGLTGLCQVTKKTVSSFVSEEPHAVSALPSLRAVIEKPF